MYGARLRNELSIQDIFIQGVALSSKPTAGFTYVQRNGNGYMGALLQDIYNTHWLKWAMRYPYREWRITRTTNQTKAI